jgi:hypothetical protein
VLLLRVSKSVGGMAPVSSSPNPRPLPSCVEQQHPSRHATREGALGAPGTGGGRGGLLASRVQVIHARPPGGGSSTYQLAVMRLLSRSVRRLSPSFLRLGRVDAKPLRCSSDLSSLNYPHVAPDPLATQEVFDEVNAFSSKRQTGVSLKTLLDTGEWGEAISDAFGSLRLP